MTDFLIDAPSDPFALLLLAHGARACMDSGFMKRTAALLAARGITVVRLEFPYMEKRRIDGVKRPPDRMPALIAAFTETAAEARARWPGLPLLIGGKSMGGRVAAMAAPDIRPAGVVCLGYPFHATGKPMTEERLSPLMASPCPVLIVQGERDALSNRADVAALSLPSAVRLIWIADGDHSLKPRKTSGLDETKAMAIAADAIAAFMKEIAP